MQCLIYLLCWQCCSSVRMASSHFLIFFSSLSLSLTSSIYFLWYIGHICIQPWPLAFVLYEFMKSSYKTGIFISRGQHKSMWEGFSLLPEGEHSAFEYKSIEHLPLKLSNTVSSGWRNVFSVQRFLYQMNTELLYCHNICCFSSIDRQWIITGDLNSVLALVHWCRI